MEYAYSVGGRETRIRGEYDVASIMGGARGGGTAGGGMGPGGGRG